MNRFREWLWKAIDWFEGKKTYIAAGVATLISAYDVFRRGGQVDWLSVVGVVFGALTFLGRALAKKPGFLVRNEEQTPDLR